MPTCLSCREETPNGANFCPTCGASLRPPADPTIERMMQDARRLLNANPDDASAHYNLALAYKLTGAMHPALREFQIVATLQPDFADAHYEVAALLAKLGRKEEAVTALQQALTAEPEHREAKRLLEKLM